MSLCCCKQNTFPALVLSSIVLAVGIAGEIAGGQQLQPLSTLPGAAWSAGIALGIVGIVLEAIIVTLYAISRCSKPATA